ncbi:hypothetical protein BX666DRAFT_1919556 [Dichotomocladium elegans]|nr:hypothetical protein BX666DRAFT_1919556 [Dichotomocladium elegans]
MFNEWVLVLALGHGSFCLLSPLRVVTQSLFQFFSRTPAFAVFEYSYLFTTNYFILSIAASCQTLLETSLNRYAPVTLKAQPIKAIKTVTWPGVGNPQHYCPQVGDLHCPFPTIAIRN